MKIGDKWETQTRGERRTIIASATDEFEIFQESRVVQIQPTQLILNLNPFVKNTSFSDSKNGFHQGAFTKNEI